VSATPANGRRGTVISVRDLFYNTPARLKYLKRPQTELSRVVDIMNRLALSYTNIAFTVISDGRDLLKTTGNGNQQQVIAAIYGRDTAQKMLSIAGEDDDFNVTGYVSLPELTRGSREYLTILVNGRFIKNFTVSNAIIHGYGSKLMIGRFPMGVININTDPLLIDVNVHPQKSEIRLSKETELSELLVQTIKARLADENLIPDAYENLYGKTKKTEYKVVQPTQIAPWLNTDLATVRPPDSEANTNTNTGSDITGISITKRSQLLARDVSTFVTKYENEATLSVFDTLETDQVTESVETYQSPFTDIAVKSQETLDVTPQRTSGFPDLSYIGQMHGTFLFAQTEDGLFLIDQHAAQERINYEYYRQKIGEVSDDKQRLLVPITINYTASDMLKIADHEQDLLHVGLTVVPFGPTSVIIREHPTWFENGQEEATIREMIDWILRDGALTVAEFREKAAIMMSCKRAIRANMHLSDAQARTLLQTLANSENPYNCPHGRPVVTQFTLTEMEKMFKRIQDSHEKWETYDNHPY